MKRVEGRPLMNEAIVVMKVHDWEDWTDKRRADVARWLREKADELGTPKADLCKCRSKYANVVTFRYNVC